MPTQRPFLSNFLAAFRVYSSPKPQPTLTTSSAVAASSQTIWTSTTSAQKPQQQQQSPYETLPSNPKPINPKTTTYTSPSSTAAAATSQDKLHASLTPLQHHVSPQTHLPRSPPSPGGLPVYGPQNKPSPSYPTSADSRRPRRRSSDSSSDGGFRESKSGGPGGEKWFVGGRAANGEEKYYKLSMIKRERSSDRISADQLSL